MSGRSDAPGTRVPAPLLLEVAELAKVSDEDLREVAAEAARDARADAELLGGYLASVLRVARSDRRLERRELELFRRLGERAAELDVPLPGLLDLYLSATWRLWRRLGLHGRAATAPAVEALAALLFRAADDTVAALARGYQDAQRLAIRAQEAMRREFVDDLLGSTADRRALEDRATSFGFNLSGAHQVAVARVSRPLRDAGPIHGWVESQVLSRFGERDVVVVTKEGLLVCIFPGAVSDPGPELAGFLADIVEGEWQVGLGNVETGPRGVARSFDHAREALEIAGRLRISEPVVPFDSVAPYALLAKDPAALSAVVEEVLGGLDAARGGRWHLVETLEAYFAEAGNITATARRLHLSPRAVSYRLRTIARLSGRRPQDPADRFVLQLAVHGLRLTPAGIDEGD